jgi:CRP-like cAMP-binding protein
MVIRLPKILLNKVQQTQPLSRTTRLTFRTFKPVMISKEDVAAIQNFVSRFISMNEAEYAEFTSRLVKRQVPKGALLLEAGRPCDHIAFITKGHFRTFCLINEEEVTYNFFFEGNFFSDYASFVSREPSIENHQALVDCEVLVLNYADTQTLFEKIPAWQKFGRLMAEYILVRIVQRNKAMLFLSPEDQYLNLMKERPKVIANIPQHYIASYLGIKPESLSRIRKRLAQSKKL